MRKSEVYSWRLSAAAKSALEEEARRQGASVASLLDRITQEWLSARRRRSASDDEGQTRLHAAAARTFGRIAGKVPYSAARTRAVIRERVTRRGGR